MDYTTSLYEQVAQLSKLMLIAAKEQNWVALAELEDQCEIYFERLNTYDPESPVTSDAYERKLASIKSIFVDDREIRNLTAPFMVKLNAMLLVHKTIKQLR